MRKSLLLIISVILYLSCQAQNIDSLPDIGLTVMSQVNQGNSFVTFPTDIGNIEPLWFEGNLIPNFYIRQSKNSKLMGVLTPQIIIRMYQEKSYPIQTPSYMPQITIYYSFSGESNSKKNITLYGRIAHHSNGQSGDFFLENGELNLKSGDFSTNYVEAGIIKTNICKWFY